MRRAAGQECSRSRKRPRLAQGSPRVDWDAHRARTAHRCVRCMKLKAKDHCWLLPHERTPHNPGSEPTGRDFDALIRHHCAGRDNFVKCANFHRRKKFSSGALDMHPDPAAREHATAL